MQTRSALRRLGGGSRQLGDGPLSSLADQLVQDMQIRETARMADAHQRAEELGSGPHLAALQRVAREYAAAALRDNAAPAITRADFHELLKTASDKTGPRDRGLTRAATHAYRLWGKDPSGVLSVGDIARLRDHYKAEYPKSRVAKVIDAQVPKIGFNTLPVARLTRLAADISHHAETAGTDLQTVYEGTIRVHGYDKNTAECFRARAFIRGLLDHSDTAEDETPDIATRVRARMATADDPILARMAQLDAEPEPEAVLDADTEYASVNSPITGEPMMLELETEERASEEGELGDNAVDVMPGDLDRLEVMGQLEELGEEVEDEIQEEVGDIPMDPTPDETVAVITDPTDPEQGRLEVTLKPLDEEPLELEPTALPHEGGKCADDACPTHKTFAVYSYVAGRRTEGPVERFTAAGMADALRRIARHGVRGEVRSTTAAFADEALIVVDDTQGQYLLVTAASESDKAFAPKVNEQQPPAESSVPNDGGDALKSAPKRKKAERLDKATVIRRCASLDLTPDNIEHKVLDGQTVTAAGWTLSVNDDTDLELRFSDGNTRTASLVHMDDVVSHFMNHVAQNTQDAPPKKVAYYDVSELFAVRCANCLSVSEYQMPEEASDVSCGSCGFTTTASAIADTFHNGDPTTGFVLIADVPDGDDPRERTLTARRILAAIQKVVPAARGLLRKDAKLQVDLDGADEPALNRVRRVLEDQYRIKAFSLRAQAVPTPMPGGAQNVPGTAPMMTPAAPAAPAGPASVGPAQPSVMPAAPGQPMAPVANTGTPAQHEEIAKRKGHFEIQYRTAGGEQRTTTVVAGDTATARMLFERFNDDVDVVRVAQVILEDDPGMPEGGGEDMPLPIDEQIEDPMAAEPATFGGGQMSPEESEAVRAALMHYRNQGLGPLAALDQLNSQYKELIGRHGEKTDQERHLVEAEAMKLAAEVWMQPAVLETTAARHGDPTPNVQQPDAVAVSNDLGKDSDSDDAVTDSLEAPSINSQVSPQGSFSDTGTAPDSDNNDPGDFGAGKPAATHLPGDQSGTSLSDTDLGRDSDTGETKTTKSWDGVCKK